MIKVSIIIPIYNGQKYLRQCIQSVLDQTLKEIEIICIDDGSTDCSVEIINSFLLKDKRIVLFQQKNQGAGIARNLALKKAKGKYVSFLDADDFYLDKDALNIMVNICEIKKIIACASLRKYIKNDVIESDKIFQNMEKNIILNYEDFQIDYNYQDFLFLREHLIEKNIYFPSYRRFQDPPFLVRALYEAKQFIVANVYLYAYRVPNIKQRFNFKYTCDLLEALRDNLIFAKKHNLNILFDKTVFRLECEYSNIIFDNNSTNDLSILKLLMQLNQIISEKYENPNYIIKPLYNLLLNMYYYEKNLLEKIKRQKEIVLYGAGEFGQVFLEYLKKNKLSEKVNTFVVSNLRGKKYQIDGIPVINFQDLEQKEEKFIWITVVGIAQKEIEKYLNEKNYKMYESVEEGFLCSIANESKKINYLS